jgi:hypothetical protein
MKRPLLLILIALAFLAGGSSLNAANTEQTTGKKSASAPKAVRPLQQFKLTIVPKYPNIGLKEYVLISDDLERDRADAEAVIQLKFEAVRAMQTKLRENFEPYLARNFIFRSNDQFFDRNEFINNRVLANPMKVKQADYLNVVVQFIGDIALVTYSNIVESQPGPGAHKANMTWADILSKEDGRWKASTVHLIRFERLTAPQQ